MEPEQDTKDAAPASHGKDLTVGSVPRHLVAFSIPMLMGSGLHAAYSMVNAIWVGRGLGTNAMAALAVSFPIFFVLMAVAIGLTLASSILVAQAYGAKDWARLHLVVQNSLVLIALVSLACVAGGNVAAEALLRAMSTPPEVLPEATRYMRLLVWTTPFMFCMFFLASVVRGVGDAKIPLFFQAGALLLTAILDPFLMFGWLGCPRFGLNGTVVANLISQVLGVVALAWYLHRKQHIASPDWRHPRLDWATTWMTLKIGVPSMAQQAMVSLGMLFVVGIVNRFGAHSSAAFGIATRIDQLAYMPAMSVSAAVSSMAGQNIGARHYDRVRQTLWWGIALSCAITLAAVVLAMGVPHFLMRIFAHDEDVIQVGAQYLRIIGLGYLLVSAMFVVNGVINGAGHTVATTCFTLVTFWVIRVPLAKYLSARMGGCYRHLVRHPG